MKIAMTGWRALGTSVHVLVSGAAALGPAATAVDDTLRAVDLAYSRFRPDSELATVNTHQGRPVAVSALFADAVAASLRAARESDGAVDPTVGRAMRVVGYDDDFPRLARSAGPLTLRVEPVPGWRSIRFDRESRTIALPPGVELDLGSTGKAFAADLAAANAHRAMRGGAVLVSLGGDIATAGDVPPDGWPVLVAEDSAMAADTDGEVIALRGGAVATSSTTVRRWTRGSIELHHIIDPTTGLPARGPWRTATVVAGSCVDANTAATAAIVLGDAALKWLTRSKLPARLVSVAGTVTRINDWPAPLELSA
ncbi:MAG: FAD:protein FMN transferase [Chloroflexi bacterium]|nr:MAG: FAD:protein FMN transferase [Chloroflexota bacterium]